MTSPGPQKPRRISDNENPHLSTEKIIATALAMVNWYPGYWAAGAVLGGHSDYFIFMLAVLGLLPEVGFIITSFAKSYSWRYFSWFIAIASCLALILMCISMGYGSIILLYPAIICLLSFWGLRLCRKAEQYSRQPEKYIS